MLMTFDASLASANMTSASTRSEEADLLAVAQPLAGRQAKCADSVVSSANIWFVHQGRERLDGGAVASIAVACRIHHAPNQSRSPHCRRLAKIDDELGQSAPWGLDRRLKVKDTTRHHGASLFVLARKAGHVACFEEKAKMSWTPWSPNIDDAVAW
jgi:hypothetical protein